ncbi:GntR family transcriptional regulator [Jeotgalibacillus proteolyticus]|uniref:GntR family transcriptional regulator n=1 Tax=Jeotgalibacillus proteolyticus TaxID=2082395 RepID=A0A2S5GAB6_9BACL|nr:GntR family transcriptional regulator [Jeotgalibacillus proteolyticus]PPA69967.1 GntR family transcriptional regulator [Jeotgalibacillus proteolyticus]
MVKNWIKSKIQDSTFVPRQKIHSESELMEKFTVSRHTVRVALGELVSEGWLYKEQGAGTYVAERTEKIMAVDTAASKSIAIIVTYISDYIFPSIIRGAENVLRQAGFQVSLFSTNSDHSQERKILETIISRKFDGVIVEPTRSAIANPNINYYLNLEAQNIPYVMINAAYDELEPVNVVLDDEKGGYLQTEHLISSGHNDIVGFFKNDDLQGLKRMKGFIKAHRKNGVPINPENIVTYSTEGKFAKPVEALKKIVQDSPTLPTGIVCYNDELAMKLLEVLRQHNLCVPDDISIIGFDDSFFADVSEVKLTSIKHPKSELGEMAAKKIIELTQNAKTNNAKLAELESHLFEPVIVYRNSTKELTKS